MIKVLLIEPVLAHYREDLYKYYLQSTIFDFTILAGDDYQGIHSLQNNNYKTLRYFKFKLFNIDFFYLKKSLDFAKKINPDVIICSGVDFHLLHTLWIYFLFYKIRKKHFFWWSHGTYGNQGRIGKQIRKIFYKNSSGIMVYSDNGKQNLLSLGINSSEICVINNAINHSDYGYLNYNIFSNKEKEINKLNILFCGRITANKKLELLFSAIKILKNKGYDDIFVSIIGDGDIFKYRELATEFKIDNIVKFYGGKYGNEAAPIYLESDLFVYPGGIGLSILQALSYGLPVITTDDMNAHGPEIELLIENKNGSFYFNNNANDLVEKILYWRNKLFNSKEDIQKCCIESIQEKGYLPELVSKVKLRFLQDKIYVDNN